MRSIAIGILGFSPELAEKCKALGLPENCSRVVIDMRVGDVTMIYYQTFGEQQILEGILDIALWAKDKSDVA